MQLDALIEDIVMGYVSNSSLGTTISNELDDLNNPDAPDIYKALLGKMIKAINMGMKKIYSELPLAEEEIFVYTNPSMDKYLLTTEHADYAGKDSDSQKWIADSKFVPFRDNIIECLYVADGYGARLHSNDLNATWGVQFPAYNIIQVPFSEDGVTLSVTYKASHPKVQYSRNRDVELSSGSNGYINTSMEIELPIYLQNALCAFVASKYYQSIESQEALAQAQLYYAEFLADIETVRVQQLLHGDYTEVDNLANEGWV